MSRGAPVLSGLALAAVLALHACASSEDRAEPPGPAQRARSFAPEWVVMIGVVHARADEALAAGESEKAHAALETALRQSVPAEIAPEHARVVHQDLWYRLSAIDLASDATQALLEAERGLALGRADDLFTADLLVARGHALRALGRDSEAASSYHEALRIDERLLQQALGSTPDGGP